MAPLRFRPSLASFLGTAAYSLTPAATAGLGTFLLWEKRGTGLLVAGGLMAALSLFLLLQDALVHLIRVEVDETSISLVGPFGRSRLRWSEVAGAVLKERENAITRTDRLLILRSKTDRIAFNASTLSQVDEARLLDFVRQRINLVVERSKPSI
jgi:Bacterial PH domain